MLYLTFIYTVLVFLVLRFSVTLFNFLSNPKLGKYGKHFNDKVSVIIEAAEEEGLAELLSSLQEQDYQDIEVIIREYPGSIFSTSIAGFCRSDPRFSIVKNVLNPATDTSGKYLLFLSPRTQVQRGLINSLIYRTKVFDLALLSIIPAQSAHGLMNKVLLPLHSFVLLNLVPLRLVRLFSSPVFSAGSRQCLFFDAVIYRRYNWLEQLNAPASGALELVKAVKQENLKAETLLGSQLILSAAPQNTKGIFLRTGTHLLSGFGNNIFAGLLYLVLVIAGPVVMFANEEYSLLVLPLGLIFLSRIMISFLARQNPLYNLLLHPVHMLMLTGSLLLAIFRKIFTDPRQKS